MADRFQELMAGWLEGNLSPAEQAELISLLEGSEELRRLDAWLQAVRFRPLATAAGVIVLSLSVFFFFQTRPVKRIEIGQFTAVMGTPTVQHSGQRSTLNPLARQSKATAALRSTVVCP